MTEQQINGHQYKRLHIDDPPPDDLDVPQFLHDDYLQDEPPTVQDAVPQDTPPIAEPQASNMPVPADAPEPEAEPETDDEQDADTAGRDPLRRVRVVITHRSTRAAARQVVYVSTGAMVAARRARDERGTSRHQRMMRAAEAAGDHARALEWEQRASKHRADRHARRMQLLRHGPVHLARSLAVSGLVAATVLVFAGAVLAWKDRSVAEVIRPLMDAGTFIAFVVDVAAALFWPLVAAAPAAGAVWLWHLGRTSGTPLPWALAPAASRADLGAVVTADSIARALAHLGIAELKAALKAGWVPVFHTPPTRDGRGYQTVFSLPDGVTATMVADKRELLAANLHRGEIECWPADAYQAKTGPARTVDLWVADAGALDGLAPEYPLLHAGVTDVFVGVPLGVTPRGEQLSVALTDGSNGVVGGRQGQGKSNAVRVVMLGAALDPLCELRAYVFAGNGDFDAYAPRLAVYQRGVGAEAVAAGVESLRWFSAEVGRREERLAELKAKKLTRGLAEKHPDLRPIVAAYSECHVMFGHKELGGEAEEFAVDTLRRARKTGMTLLFDTQSSRANAIPGAVIELMGWNACFSVKNWRSNDGFLGDGSFQAGIRATELRFGVDRGTSLVTGVSENPFELLKWHFIEVNDDTGFDAAAEVIARAMAAVDLATPVRDTATPAPAPEVRDLLADLDEVLGSEPIPIADAPGMLRNLAPAWRPYRELTGKALRQVLSAEYGITVPTTGNRYPLDPAVVRRALARRGADDAG